MRRLLSMILASCTWFCTADSCEYCFISEHGYVFDMNRTLIRLDSRLQLFSGLTNSSSLNDNVTTRYLTTFLTVNVAAGRWGYTLSLPYVYRAQRNTIVGSPSLHFEHAGRVVSTVDSSALETQSSTGLGDASAIDERFRLATGVQVSL